MHILFFIMAALIALAVASPKAQAQAQPVEIPVTDEDISFITDKSDAIEQKIYDAVNRKVKCSSKDLNDLEKEILYHEVRASTLTIKAQRREWFDRDGKAQTVILELARQYAVAASSIRLAHADASLKLSCLDLADRGYRSIISNYTGAAYSAQRERAMIGIADVREKRRK